MPTQSITTLSNANHTFPTTASVFKNLQRSYLLPINSCITERRKNWTLNGQRRNLRYVLSWGTCDGFDEFVQHRHKRPAVNRFFDIEAEVDEEEDEEDDE
jgi:hypothetical protein